jgi:flagellar hook assembly protein FlgD
VLDARGRLVRTLLAGPVAAGPHESTWDGRDAGGHRVASGAYGVRLEAPGFEASRRVVLVK